MVLKEWKDFVRKAKNPKRNVNIAIVGKYFETGEFVLSDAYVSVIEAVKYSAFHQGANPVLSWLSSKSFEDNPRKVEELKQYDGVIVPGGFGETGIEGKINVIKYCRENKIPYFGLCYGMQLMTIEYARNVAGLKARTRQK
jgi:CTP synthase